MCAGCFPHHVPRSTWQQLGLWELTFAECLLRARPASRGRRLRLGVEPSPHLEPHSVLPSPALPHSASFQGGPAPDKFLDSLSTACHSSPKPSLGQSNPRCVYHLPTGQVWCGQMTSPHATSAPPGQAGDPRDERSRLGPISTGSRRLQGPACSTLVAFMFL